MTTHLLDERLPELLARADNLPSLPSVALEVIRLSGEHDADIDKLAETISRDSALVVKLLKLANSPLFNAGREIGDMNQATMTLGLKTVQLMSLSFSLVSSLPQGGSLGNFSYSEYWRRGLMQAAAGRAMANAMGRSALAGEAFVCGMLGNIGQLILAQCLPELYQPVLEASGDEWPTYRLEEHHLGFAHVDVGYLLLGEWGLPRAIIEGVYCLNGDAARRAEVGNEHAQLIDVMSLACLATRVICDTDHGTPLVKLHQRAKSLGLTSREVAQLLLDLEADVARTAELLDIELPEALSHAVIMEQARQQVIAISLSTVTDLKNVSREASRLESENRQLQTRATTDRLTGLANRASFDAMLEKEIDARLRGRSPGALGLLMMDIDNFKHFNDSYGHQAGDAVLQAVGALLTDVTRTKDTPARYGGEEFVVVVPLATPGILAVIAERIRRSVQDMKVQWEGQSLEVTVSVGGACLSQPGTPEGGAALLRVADEQLYLCKKNGRNCTRVVPQVLDLPTAGPHAD